MQISARNITYLRDEVLFEFRQEFKIEKIIRCKSFLTDHSFHGLHIFTDSVASILILPNIKILISIDLFLSEYIN